jgi:hypothetical protein
MSPSSQAFFQQSIDKTDYPLSSHLIVALIVEGGRSYWAGAIWGTKVLEEDL